MAKSKQPTTEWRNRIVGHGQQAASQFQANPSNWRIHPEKQRAALDGVLDEVGWVQSVIVNINTGFVVDGHARIEQALKRGDDTPVPFIEVDLTEAEENKILATLDPLSALAATDKEQLGKLMHEVETGDAGLMQMLSELAEDNGVMFGDSSGGMPNDGDYTNKITAPIYQPTGPKPAPRSLFDDTKARKLAADIEAAGLPEDETQFLLAAAQRHTVLDFKSIANYYAHASPEVQRLMEDSALIIIDFDRAIELGYVKLSKRTAELEGEQNAE